MMFHLELYQHLKADEVVDFLNRFPDGWQYNVSGSTCILLRYSNSTQNELLFFGVYFCERAMWKPVGPRLPGQEELHDTLMSFRRRWWGDENYTDQPDPVVRPPQDPSPSKFGIIGQQRPLSYDRGFHGRGGMSFDMGSVSSGTRRENKNHVNVDRIRAGTDVRTTVSTGIFDVISWPASIFDVFRSCSATFQIALINLYSSRSLMTHPLAVMISCTYVLVWQQPPTDDCIC